MEISELRTGDADAWDSYVHESDTSTFYHQIGWRNVVLKTYGHKPRYLVARGDDGGTTRGSADVSDGGMGVWQEAGLWLRLRRMVGCALMLRGLGRALVGAGTKGTWLFGLVEEMGGNHFATRYFFPLRF